MAHLLYFVLLQGGHWTVHVDDHRSGSYHSQNEALRSAIAAAQHAGERGHEAQVLLQEDRRGFRAKWTYGKDPYPPI